MHRKTLVIVTPALADANNGNWHTARRWARMLGKAYRVHLVARWQGEDAALMIALHARRSAASVAGWREVHPSRPLALVLTGTDLYRDIDVDRDAQRSLALADRLVVLNDLGASRLPEGLRARCDVVLQSCPARRPVEKARRHLTALMVGHLRDEKDPLTYLRAAERLIHRTDLHFDHVGSALDPALGAAAEALAARHPRYRWLGPRPHAEARRRIQAAHLLVNASRMEGGAQVVIEAVRSGTPVIASRIDGHLGLVGADHPALFDPSDDAALAALIQRARDDPLMLPGLRQRQAMLAPRFAPEAESAALHRVVHRLLNPEPGESR